MDQASALPPMPYGERFRKHRRWMHDAVGSRERLAALRTMQLRGTRILLRNLLRTPGRFVEHLHLCVPLHSAGWSELRADVSGRRYVAATMLEITYGRRITSLKDEMVEVADRALEGINAAGSPGSMIVDFFPVRACSASDAAG